MQPMAGGSVERRELPNGVQIQTYMVHSVGCIAANTVISYWKFCPVSVA